MTYSWEFWLCSSEENFRPQESGHTHLTPFSHMAGSGIAVKLHVGISEPSQAAKTSYSYDCIVTLLIDQHDSRD